MAEIIQLTPKSAEEIKASLPIKKQGRFCAHKAVEVDIEERQLRCQQCNAVIEAFDFVLSMAYEERNQLHVYKQLKQDISGLREQKERLEKDVTNLKAQKRRLA